MLEVLINPPSLEKTLSRMKKLVLYYFAFIGLAAHLTLIVGGYFLLQYYKLTPSQFVVSAVEKSGLNLPWLVELVSPAPAFTEHVFDGHIVGAHPRILFPDLRNWEGKSISTYMTARLQAYDKAQLRDFDPCKGNDIMRLAACWVVHADPEKAEQLVQRLKQTKIQTPDVQARYGNGWELALAYDLVYRYPGLSQDDKLFLESKLEHALVDYLRVLDDDAPSLWHGRTSLAAMAWICAVVLGDGTATRAELVRRAQGHFLDVVRATELVEVWPEGYNYWIQNRALVLTLALTAYYNGLENSQQHDRILSLLKRIAAWHVYATRPDNRIQGYGDEGSRVDLKDQTRWIIDLIAQVTREPVFATYSNYIYKLHGAQSYWGGFRWGFQLFKDPTLNGAAINDADLSVLNPLLPKAELFGKNGSNSLFIRSGWGRDDTFISYRASQNFTHHGHYDAGHFTLFKAAPLAINSSTYRDFKGDNRLNYSLRSVAKNTLLILRPGEQVQPNRYFTPNVADGGQRITMPTGSAIKSVAHWAENKDKGLHLKAADLLHYDHVENQYTYISNDLTAAYNNNAYDDNGHGGKVTSVQRNLVYLHTQDQLIVYDLVASTDASYTKKWLLHSVNRPQVEGLAPLVGEINNGIAQSHDSRALIQNGSGYLAVDRVYPQDALMRTVGGTDYQFYVEADGDDSQLNGKNFNQGASFQPWFDVGLWRIEIQPATPAQFDEFLVVLSPGVNQPRKEEINPVKITKGNALGVRAGRSLVVFAAPAGHSELQIEIPPATSDIYVFGLPDMKPIRINDTETKSSNKEGVLRYSIISDTKTALTLVW